MGDQSNTRVIGVIIDPVIHVIVLSRSPLGQRQALGYLHSSFYHPTTNFLLFYRHLETSSCANLTYETPLFNMVRTAPLKRQRALQIYPAVDPTFPLFDDEERYRYDKLTS